MDRFYINLDRTADPSHDKFADCQGIISYVIMVDLVDGRFLVLMPVLTTTFALSIREAVTDVTASLIDRPNTEQAWRLAHKKGPFLVSD